MWGRHFCLPETNQAGRNASPACMSELDYSEVAARGRQRRLLAEMQTLRLDLVIVQQIEHVQWLTGARYPWTMSPSVVLRADGHVTLVAPVKPQLEAAADTVVHYEAQWHSTLRNDQRQASSVELLQALTNKASIRRRAFVLHGTSGCRARRARRY